MVRKVFNIWIIWILSFDDWEVYSIFFYLVGYYFKYILSISLFS